MFEYNPSVQDILEGMLRKMQRERSATQMTLGKLIAVLESLDAAAPVANLFAPHCYRGYYFDLSFQLGIGTRPAGELLAECRSCMGRAFVGYRGGDYVMGERTPLWVAAYGSTGMKLLDLRADGTIVTGPDC